MSFSDRFELLEEGGESPARQPGVQTFQARERATGKIFEAHFAADPGLLSNVAGAIDQGRHSGKSYVVTAVAVDPSALSTAGAWRIQPVQPAPSPQPAPPGAAPPPSTPEPGDFTRMFQLRQMPEPVSEPEPKPTPVGVASQPGQFTRAFQRPAAAPPAMAPAVSDPGVPGEFTRMFQTPGSPAAAPQPVETLTSDADQALTAQPVPRSDGQASQPTGKPGRALVGMAILVLAAIAVYILLRTLY